MGNKLLMTVIVLAGAMVAGAQTTYYRDAAGRTQGSVTTDRNGKTTWRDSTGHIQGTSTTDRYGKTTYRDSSGRIIGTRTVR